MSYLFCQIANDLIPCHKIWESEEHMAFLSIYPNTEGVTVVIPKKHLSSYLFDQDDEEISKRILASKKVAEILDNYFNDVGRTAAIFEGYGVDHLHCKLFPIHETDNDSSFKKISSNVNKYFYRYEGYVSSHDHNRADDQYLANLAKMIRHSVDSSPKGAN